MTTDKEEYAVVVRQNRDSRGRRVNRVTSVTALMTKAEAERHATTVRSFLNDSHEEWEVFLCDAELSRVYKRQMVNRSDELGGAYE